MRPHMNRPSRPTYFAPSRCRLFIALIVCATCGWLTSARADVVVVVSVRSAVASLKAEQVAEIFLGKRLAYPDGADAVPIDQPENSIIRDLFYTTLTGKTPALLKAYWSKLLFTGQGQPPREVASAEAVKKLVASNAKFIGYLDKDALDENVKVVFTPK